MVTIGELRKLSSGIRTTTSQLHPSPRGRTDRNRKGSGRQLTDVPPIFAGKLLGKHGKTIWFPVTFPMLKTGRSLGIWCFSMIFTRCPVKVPPIFQEVKCVGSQLGARRSRRTAQHGLSRTVNCNDPTSWRHDVAGVLGESSPVQVKALLWFRLRKKTDEFAPLTIGLVRLKVRLFLKMPLDFGLKDLRLDIMPGYMSLWPQHPKFYHQYRHVCHNTQNVIINTGMFARTPKILSSIPACLRYGRGDMLSVHCSLWCDKLWGKAKKWFGLGAATSMCQGLSPSSVLERCQFELDGTYRNIMKYLHIWIISPKLSIYLHIYLP